MQSFTTSFGRLLPALLFAITIVGLLASRAVLSIAHGLWVLYFLLNIKRNELLFRGSFCWSLVPLVLFVAGLYQQPTHAANYDYLLTLIIYPIAAISTQCKETIEQWKLIYIGLGLASLLYPISWYLFHMQEAHVWYGQGRSLPTLMDTDHVRYGIFLNSVLLVTASAKRLSNTSKITIISFLIIMIVLMAVRTAWIGLILIIVVKAFDRTSIAKLFRWLAILLLPIGLLAYLALPTVRQKVAYTIYDQQQYDPSTYKADFSDGARRSINYAAYNAVQAGNASVGWAAIPATLQQHFEKEFPGQKLSYGWPFNQYLFWWMGAGSVIMIAFSMWLLLPVLNGLRYKNFNIVAWSLVVAASCVVESTLSLQYGVFLHAWPLMLLWKKLDEPL